MGASQSQERITAFEKDYVKESRTNHPYFGNHSLLINRNEKKLVICKQMVFHFSAEYKQFLSEYEKIERKPFNIIYPSLIIKSDGLETCSNIYEVSVYYDLIGKNLTQVVKAQGLFTENKAWFLLNEVSKSLPHWAICPQNIYQNEYQNYFIFDSFFVLGIDPQSFLMKKLENSELMSEKMQILLEKGLTVSPTEGFQEDCYCLGFVILFVLTGIHPTTLPKDYQQKNHIVKGALHERRPSLSSELIEVVLQLVERQTLRRMDNYQLRRLLKDKEAEIIRNEEYDYEKSRKIEGDTQRQKPHPSQQKLNLSKSHYNNHQTSMPVSNFQHEKHPNPNEFYAITPNKNQQPRMRPQVHHQSMVFRSQQPPFAPPPQIHMPFNGNSFPQVRKIYHETHHVPQSMEFPLLPSDRSNTLTRINSYDRLIPKQ